MRKKKGFFASLMALVMVFTILAQPLHAVPASGSLIDEGGYLYHPGVELLAEAAGIIGIGLPLNSHELLSDDMGILLSTLTEPLGAIGFDGYNAIVNLNEDVDIIVTFRTPPAVALRLIAEAMPFTPFGLDDQDFVGYALEAHSRFEQQLGSLPMPFGAGGGVEILSRHNLLFNGMFMRVPAHMVEAVAALPEVFAVTPDENFYAIGEMDTTVELPDDNYDYPTKPTYPEYPTIPTYPELSTYPTDPTYPTIPTHPQLPGDPAAPAAPIVAPDVYEIVIAPLASLYVAEGSFYQLTAILFDYFGQPVYDAQFAWEIVDAQGDTTDVWGVTIEDGLLMVASRARLGEVVIRVSCNNTGAYTTTAIVIAMGVLPVFAEYVPSIGYTPHPDFNQGAIELFELNRIRDELGLSGRNVRVAVIDSGVDYRHPVFAPFLRPVQPGGWGAVEIDGRMYTLPGANTLQADPCFFWGFEEGPANTHGLLHRPRGINTSPMELSHNPAALGLGHPINWNATNHGTHVAGTVVAMAPGIELLGFRAISQVAAAGGAQSGSVVRALEISYIMEADIVNLSLGNVNNTPWQANSYATNLLSLAGVVVIGSAGNNGAGSGTRQAGLGGWFSLGGGDSSASLGIAVGMGHAGGLLTNDHYDSIIDGVPSVIRLRGRNINFNPQVMVNQSFGFTYFGHMGWFESRWPGNNNLPDGGGAGAHFAEMLEAVRTELLGGYDLTGQVMIINRVAGVGVTVRALAYALNAEAVISVNNEPEHTWPGGVAGLTDFNAAVEIPVYFITQANAREIFGFYSLPFTPEYPRTGNLFFGNIEQVQANDTLAAGSSVGPLGPRTVLDVSAASMHLKPDIVGPGQAVWSTSNTDLHSPAYVSMGGTSMSAPAVAGIAALMVEHWPNAEPWEIKARMMNTARPLVGYAGQYSVLQVGAGFIDPPAIFATDSFATVVHPIPFAGGILGDGTGTGAVQGVVVGNWAPHTMSSLSFGRVNVLPGVSAQTAVIPITVQGAGSWNISHEFVMPTMQLLAPNQPHLWGPPLTHTVTGVSLVAQRTGPNAFNILITHDGRMANHGFAQGYITLTNGSETLTMPFGAYFDVADIPVFTGSNPANLQAALLRGEDAVVAVSGNLGIFEQHSPFVIPEGRTLVVATTLNVQGNARLVIEGTLAVADGGRINNQGGPAGGTIVIAEGGILINNGHVENVTNSGVLNLGTIINNNRFEVRANTWWFNAGTIEGSNPINIHRDAIVVTLDALIAVISSAPAEQGYYTAYSWNTMRDALATAISIRDSVRATQIQVDEATLALRAAIDALAEYAQVITDAEFLQTRAADILRNGLTQAQLELSANNRATLTLILDGREFVLATNVNNRNVSGRIMLPDGSGELVFDIRGNGSNVAVFNIIER